MTEEKKQSGFRVKWGDKEIEYYGESSKDEFEKVFSYFQTTKPAESTESVSQPDNSVSSLGKQSEAFGQEYQRLSKDSGLPVSEIAKKIKFEKKNEFPHAIPSLPDHPELVDAVRLITYSLQVGVQKPQVEVSQLKLILKDPNGYPVPGRELGLILADFRESDVIIASQAQARNKPFCLSTKGLSQARELLKIAKKDKN